MDSNTSPIQRPYARIVNAPSSAAAEREPSANRADQAEGEHPRPGTQPQPSAAEPGGRYAHVPQVRVERRARQAGGAEVRRGVVTAAAGQGDPQAEQQCGEV